MKIRDLFNAILDFELSKIGGALLFVLSLVISLIVRVLQIYKRIFFFLIPAVLLFFVIEDREHYYGTEAFTDSVDNVIKKEVETKDLARMLKIDRMAAVESHRIDTSTVDKREYLLNGDPELSFEERNYVYTNSEQAKQQEKIAEIARLRVKGKGIRVSDNFFVHNDVITTCLSLFGVYLLSLFLLNKLNPIVSRMGF